MFGIKNCDTIKKARQWLDTRSIPYAFHDYKSAGIDRARVERWCRLHGWETICNRTGQTFRKLPPSQKDGLDERKAIDLMVAQPSMIKRPILEVGERTLVGFDPGTYAALEDRGSGFSRG